MDYNKIIIALVVVLLVVAVAGFVFMNQPNKVVPDNKTSNNTSSSSFRMAILTVVEPISMPRAYLLFLLIYVLLLENLSFVTLFICLNVVFKTLSNILHFYERNNNKDLVKIL